MKKKKNKISMTAKQRKEQRLKESGVITDERKLSDEQKQQKKKSRNKLIIRITAIALTCVIAITLIVVGIVFALQKTEYDNELVNPYAVITLSDGSEIEMELLWKQQTNSRAIIANFIYLSENLFFNDTMFSNIQGDFLVMNGFTSPTTHKGKNEDFMATLQGFSGKQNKWGISNYKLGYRLTTRANAPSGTNEGYMAFMSGNDSTYGSSTSFVMLASDTQPMANNTNLTLSYFARLTAPSIARIKQICAMEKSSESFKNVDNWFAAANNQGIMIKKITIKKLNSTIKTNIMNHFEEYVYNSSSKMEGALKGGSNFTRTNVAGYINTALS